MADEGGPAPSVFTREPRWCGRCRPGMAAHRMVGLVAVAALAGCGSVESPPAPAGGLRVASTPVAASAFGWSTAGGSGDRLYSNVGHDAQGRVVTRVAIAARDGATRSIRLVRGSWSAP